MAPTDDAPTRRDFEHLSDTVAKLTRTLEGLQVMMAATYVRQDVYERDQKLHEQVHEAQDEALEDINSLKDWAIRLIVGAVMLALLGTILVQGG